MFLRSKFLFITLILSIRLFSQNDSLPYILVLGIAQDAGYPQMGCKEECCSKAWTNDSLKRSPACLALVSPKDKKWWLLEATPDIKEQLQEFSKLTNGKYNFLPEGIFITHAHIGHYTGLMQLGREVMNAKEMPVYVLAKMKTYLEKNGPWSQLVQLKNISLKEISTSKSQVLNSQLSVETFTVPHRDEFSETAGFVINNEKRKYMFIPDIDKWTKFNGDIVKKVNDMDYAFLDATFYSAQELPGRNMEEIPHPMVKESMSYFGWNFEINSKKKIIFIHFNHSNPLLRDKGLRENLNQNGYQVAEEGMRVR